MTSVEQAMAQVLVTGKEVYIPCMNEAQQNSVRALAFNAKRNMTPEMREQISVLRYEENGKLYIKIFKRPMIEFLTRGEDGSLVTLPPLPEADPELDRQVRLMREAGESEEFIQEVIKNWQT